MMDLNLSWDFSLKLGFWMVDLDPAGVFPEPQGVFPPKLGYRGVGLDSAGGRSPWGFSPEIGVLGSESWEF